MRKVAVSRLGICSVAVALLISVSTVNAQLPATRLFAVFPTGAQAGTSVDVTVTSGVDLEETAKLLFDHPGIVASPKMQTVGGISVPVPNQFVVTVGADVPPGHYDLRAVGFFGISNPRYFVVDSRQERIEAEPNNAREQANALEWNQIVNGRVTGGADVDWYKFTGKAGQRLLVSCMARRLDSKLDAALELYNAAGRRLEFARRNLGGQDPLIDITIPADGDFFVKLYDFTYAGGEDYPYRLMVSSGPYIDYILPASGTAGSNAQYTLYGRNLPGGQSAGIAVHGRPLDKVAVSIALPSTPDFLDPKLTLAPFSAGIDAVPFSINSPVGPSNLVMVQFGEVVPVLELEPNDKGSQAQKIVVPGEINGQFQNRGDVDCYQFEAKAKDAYWIEVIAHRAGAAIDPVVVIDQLKINEKGEESLTRISTLDDDPNNPLANLFDTLNDDNSAKFVAPADGTYRVTIRERYGNSKQDLGVYRFIIRNESPDFRVVAVSTTLAAPGQRQAVPSEITLRKGDHFPVHVVALRRDGFAGQITVSAEGLPPGVTCRDISLGTAPSSGVLVFSSAEDCAAWAGRIQILAKARIDDPVAVERLTAANAAAQTSIDALSAANKALTQPAEELAKANEALTAAKVELAGNPEDEPLKAKVADAEAKVVTSGAAHKTADDARIAAERKVQENTLAVQQAEAAKLAAVRDVSHLARNGTIVWGAPQPNIPGEARVTQSIELSVMDEPSPYQITTDVHRVDANHSRQILVPVKVQRRNGFDQAVNITVVGQPPNAQVENKPISKEKNEEFYRIFIPPNVPVGTYVTYLTGQAQVSYRKNPAKADRLKAEFGAAEQNANIAQETLKTAVTTREMAVKKVTDDETTLKKLIEFKQQSDKLFAEAHDAEKLATDALNGAGENPDVKAAAEKRLAEAQEAAKAATVALADAEKARAEAEQVSKQAEGAKIIAEAEMKRLDELNKAAMAEKAAAEQRFKTAETYAKPNNLPFHPTTTPIVITVKLAPYTLSAIPADTSGLKAGAKVDVKCEVKRQNGFVGPVTLTLPLPPNLTGVKAEPVTIPADQSAAVLQIEAASDAAEAPLENLVVRAISQWDGEAAVDQPLTLKVVK